MSRIHVQITLYSGFLEEVKNTVEDGKVTYEHAGTYVEDCMETLRSLSELQITLVKTYREKIQNESQEILTGISGKLYFSKKLQQDLCTLVLSSRNRKGFCMQRQSIGTKIGFRYWEMNLKCFF